MSFASLTPVPGRLLRLTLVVSTLVSLPLVVRAQSLINLGAPAGSGGFSASAINDSGQVVGSTPFPIQAYLYSGGSFQNLGTLPGGSGGYAYGLNASGQAVGEAFTGAIWSSPSVPVIYSGGSAQSLGTLGGNYGFASDINDAGNVTGSAFLAGDVVGHAFFYSGGVMQDLGSLGGDYAAGMEVNNLDQVAGFSDTTGGLTSHAFLYSDGTMQDLGTLGGSFSIALALNDAGQVAGHSTTTGDLTNHAFLYTGGTMQDLGTLGGGYSEAWDINNAGDVVGYSTLVGSGYGAFLYTGGAMHNLNTLYAGLLSDGSSAGFMHLTDATGINNVGQIVGNGLYFDGTDSYYTSYLLDTRVTEPEVTVPDTPGTLGLLAFALAGLAAVRRSSRQNR
jgi:probable HAF family extracellular repeat protein